MYSIVLITEEIASKLQSQLNEVGLRWKSSDSTTTYVEAKPMVYAFTYDDLDGGNPLHTPSVLVQVLGIDPDGVSSFLIHVCISYPSIQDKEITKPVQGVDGVYEYKTGDGIDSAGVRSELYKACLMLGERVFVSLGKISNTDIPIRNIQLNTPNPYMEQFPYCDCTVSFDVECSQIEKKLNTDVWKYL